MRHTKKRKKEVFFGGLSVTKSIRWRGLPTHFLGHKKSEPYRTFLSFLTLFVKARREEAPGTTKSSAPFLRIIDISRLNEKN